MFTKDSKAPPSEYFFWDLPSARHAGSGTVSFTDGSVEVKRWGGS
jgi:prepilin-type processing-associated H-X9-DG protein